MGSPQFSSPELAAVDQAVAAGQYEIARRRAEGALAATDLAHPDRNCLLLLQHRICRQLGDRSRCGRALDEFCPGSDDERLELALRRAGDAHFFSGFSFYRTSAESRQGYTGDEYRDQLEREADTHFGQAETLACSPEQRQRLADALHQAGRRAQAAAICAPPATGEHRVASRPWHGAGVLTGTLVLAGGQALADARVTLGLEVTEAPFDPDRYRHLMGNNYAPVFSPLETRTTQTDAAGRYRFDNVPVGCHEFLAVNLDPGHVPVSVRFLAHKITVADGATTEQNAVIADWASAPSRIVPSPFPPELVRDGVRCHRIGEDRLSNPFRFTFPRQALELTLPAGAVAESARLLLLSSTAPEASCPLQVAGDRVRYFTDLPPESDRVFALYQAEQPLPQTDAIPALALVPDADGTTAVVDTGAAAVRIPWGSGTDALAPIIQVCGPDAVWRGCGRLVLPRKLAVRERQTSVLEHGPLLLKVQITYRLIGDHEYRLTLTFHRGEAYVLAHEVSPDVDGAAFEFSLAEFVGGRGYLHWKAEGGDMHWSDLSGEDRLLARLEESVPWWCPPEAFAYAMTGPGLASQDVVGVFTIRRGEWVDRKFAAIASGPGADGWELDWPQPEMVGSTISMITAHTAPGDAFFRFGLFAGERHWGLLISSVAVNDGPYKELSAVQHKNSSPRLQEFKNWRLDHQDSQARPSLLIDRDRLPELRRRRTDPLFEPYWKRITALRSSGGGQHANSAAGAFRALVDSDVVLAWHKKRELVDISQPRSLSILLGRDFGDEYSPVGARPIAPWAEDFDLLAPTGAFTADEERLVRSYLVLMGHMFMQPDFMNWHFNARNANFEADRADTVGVIGLCFRDSPDGQLFIDHARERLKSMITIYANPQSGKWYENPACYYLHSVGCFCNLAFHLARHGLLNPADIPRLKEFLGWAVLLLTPRLPADYDTMRDGADAAAYSQLPKVRRLPPVGDHAHLGPWIPEHHALMARYFQAQDPAFADLLRWAYNASGKDGGYHGNALLFFSLGEAADLVPPTQTPVLASRRLEGFGALFRGNFDRDDEFYLLLKLGPCGYRYHRTEGSFLLCVDGKPLIYDGGEAGETWRHSTLSFYDTHTMLAPGHIERFSSLPELDFAQGVHPVALKPGEPDFLSNDCRHELVDLAWKRFREPRPADSRSVTWIKDEYVIVHDELDVPAAVPTHWHLQVVAHDETGSLEEGYRFRGRFGTDLQVLLPGLEAARATITPQATLEVHLPPEECFAMRHLQVTGEPGTGAYLAVLRPLSGRRKKLKATPFLHDGHAAGVRIRGAGITDVLMFRRNGMTYAGPRLSFRGRYGAVLRRGDSVTLVLLDGHALKVDGITLRSTGPAVSVTTTPGAKTRVTAQGTGDVSVLLPGGEHAFTLTGNRIEVEL